MSREVVVDTNVWLDAAFRRRVGFAIWLLMRGDVFTPVVVPAMVREITWLLEVKEARGRRLVGPEMDCLREVIARSVDVSKRSANVRFDPQALADPGDMKLLSAAARTEEGIIVTSDKQHLLSQADYLEGRGIKVLKPDEFLGQFTDDQLARVGSRRPGRRRVK